MTNYDPSSVDMAVRAEIDYGYTGEALDAIMSDVIETVQIDHRNGNFQDPESYIDNNMWAIVDNLRITPELVGEVWNNGGYDHVNGTLEDIIREALEDMVRMVAEAMPEHLEDDEDDEE